MFRSRFLRIAAVVPCTYFVPTFKPENMKIVKRILLVLLVLVLAAVVIGFLMPGSRKIERSVAMGVPAMAIYGQINELKNWPNWSPWYKLDPNAKIVYSEPSSGLNAWYTWESDNKNVGKGKMTIVEVQDNGYIKTKLEFDGMKEAYGYFRLEPQGESTQVTWGLDAEFGNNPIFRLMGPMMDKMLGETFTQGLTGLEAAAKAASVNIQSAATDSSTAAASDTTAVN